MKMKKLLQVLVVFFFVFSCTKDTFEEPKADDTNPRIAADQFDNSHLGVYKGLFTTVDGLTRGSVVVTLSPTNEGLAQITLSSGEIIELKSSRVKLTVDNTVSNLRFSSAGLSEIDATLDFSVEGDGINPVISSVSFDNNQSDIFIAKNLSRAPLTPITGTYIRTAGTGGFPNSGRTWNVMSIGAGNAQTFATQIAFGGRVYTTPAGNNVQSGCATAAGYTTCNITGSAYFLGHNITWGGTHRYNAGNASNEPQCAQVSGTWNAPSFGGSSGTFVSDTNCTGPAVANDLCAGAISVGIGTYTGSSANASTTGAPGTCNSVTLNTASGVWYSFTTPTVKNMIIDTQGSAYDTKLGVFSGSCAALTCVSANDDINFPSNPQSKVSFTAAAGLTYYFYVTGYLTNSGNYTLNVIESIPPANNLCANATPISVGGTASGDTTTATNAGAPGTCNSVTLNTAPGVWFSFTTPTAKLIKVNTIGSAFDTRLGVSSGSCAALTCVTANDNGPTGVTPQSELTFSAAAGTNYYFYVTGTTALISGTYTINVIELFPPANDLCANSTAVNLGTPVSGTTVNGNTTGAPGTCNSVTLNTSPGVWHTYTTPTTKLIKASTVGSNFDTRLGVVTGTCGGTLTCVTANDNGPTGVTPQSELTFTATGGATYRLYVTGTSAAVSGNYTLTLTELLPPANDLCANATTIACGGTSSGSTTSATTTGIPTASCTTSLNQAGGVWYRFSTPTAQQVTVNTVGSDYDTKLGVYSGSCTGLVCVAGNDDGPTGITPRSQVIFTAAAGTNYFFYVTGFVGTASTGIGNYTINVSCIDPPPPVVFSLTPGCGTTLVDHAGNGNYSNNRNDTYRMTAPVGQVIRLPFTVFNMEETFDFIRIYNSTDGVTLGAEITSVTNGTRTVTRGNFGGTDIGFTGTGTTGQWSLQGMTVTSSGRYLIVTFRSDGSTTAAGFLATVTCGAARMAGVSNQLTSDTFLPAISSKFPKVRMASNQPEQLSSQEYERIKIENDNRMKREIERREQDRIKTQIEVENRQLERSRNENLIFKSDAEKAEWIRKNG